MKKILIFIFITFFLVSACDTSKKKKKVCIISSYNQNFKWVKGYEKSIKMSLGKTYTIQSIYLDFKNSWDTDLKEMAQKTFAKIEKIDPMYIIVADDPALKLLGPKLSRMSTPVVFLGINNSPTSYVGSMPKNFTGVLERPFLHRNIDIISKILPKTKKIAVLFDGELSSQIVKKKFFGGKNQVTKGNILVDLYLIPSYKEWQYTVKGFDSYDACILGLYSSLKDSSGKIFSPQTVLQWTNENMPVPMFGLWDFSIGQGGSLGGHVASGEEQGQQAAEILKKLAAGTPAAKIPPEAGGRGFLIFSKSELERYHLKLPDDLASTAQMVD